ncbi:hypothetical protein VTO42DRAFT_7021 [Malbranchea cinnamomea]
MSNDIPKDDNTAEAETVEVVTWSRDPEKTVHYELNGLRTYVEGVDHSKYNARSLPFIMTTLGCAFALAASQITSLLYLTVATHISHELHTSELSVWFLTAPGVAMGALAPFVGPLADLFGRKNIFLFGIICGIVGSVAAASTPTGGGFVASQAVLGIAAVVEELMAIAVVAESVPTSKRPIYAAIILTAIIPWSPGTMYANWMAQASWRWIGCALGIWNAIILFLIWPFYHPPPRVNSMGLSRKEMVRRIDFVGGILVTLGLVFVLIALSWGGQDYPWDSAHVLSFLIIGFGILFAFAAWELWVVRYPLYPRRMVYAPRPFFCMLFVIFAAGINYVPLVVFWPIHSISVFNSDRFETGLNTLPIGTCILGGAILSAILLSMFKRHVTPLMTMFCVIQTVACACLTVIDPHNISTAFPPIVLALVGVGGVLVPNQVIITVITPDDLIASVTALTVGLRAQAQVIGLAIFYNRFVNELTSKGINYLLPAVTQARWYDLEAIVEMMTALTSVPFKEYALTIPELRDPAAYEAVREATVLAFSAALRLIYFITIAFGVPACIAAVFMGDVSKYMDHHVAVVL